MGGGSNVIFFWYFLYKVPFSIYDLGGAGDFLGGYSFFIKNLRGGFQFWIKILGKAHL